MQYRYRVEGKVKQSFILRGAYFNIGSTIEFYVSESELPFVKERCELKNINDMEKPTEPKNPISTVAKQNKKTKRTVKK